MELKIFRDTMPQAGTVCTVKAELPLETEILVSDYLPPVFKLVKCFAKPVILQKQLQPGRLTLEGYLRCTVYYQGEEGAGLCQTEQKLPFTKQLELPEFDFTAWTAVVEGQTEYLNSRVVNPRRMEVQGAVGLVATVRTQNKAEVITALADGGIEQQLDTLQGVRSIAVLDKLISAEGELAFPSPPAAVLHSHCTGGTAAVRQSGGQGRSTGAVCLACRAGNRIAEPEHDSAVPAGAGCGRPDRGLQVSLRGGAGRLLPDGRAAGRGGHPVGQPDAASAGLAQLPAAICSGCLFHPV